MNNTNAVAGSITRHTLTAGGVAGLVAAQDDILKLVSLLVTVVGLVWSIYEKLSRKNPPPPVPPAAILFLLFSLLVFSIFATGCNTLTLSATKPDGSTIKVTSCRMIWSTEAYKANVPGYGSLEATKSSVDAAAIAAAASGAVQGALAAAGKP